MYGERTSFGILYSTFSLWIRWWHNGWYDKCYVFKKRGEEECNLRIHKRAAIIKASILCAFLPRTSKCPKISWSCVLTFHSVGYEEKYWTVFDCNKNKMLQYYENMHKMLQHWDPNTLNDILALNLFTNHWIIYSTRPTNIIINPFRNMRNWMVTKLLKCLQNLLRYVFQKVQVATESGFTAFSSASPAGNLSFCSVKAISGSDLSACTGG